MIHAHLAPYVSPVTAFKLIAFAYKFLPFQDKGAHIIVGTFHHLRAREVFCQVREPYFVY